MEKERTWSNDGRAWSTWWREDREGTDPQHAPQTTERALASCVTSPRSSRLTLRGHDLSSQADMSVTVEPVVDINDGSAMGLRP